MKNYRYIAILFILFLLSCEDRSTDPDRFVPKPTFHPGSAHFTAAFSMQILCEMSEASIFYTTDGSLPSNQSTFYIAPIQINDVTTVKAIAYRPGYRASEVATANYSFDKVATPEISLPEGVYYSTQEVSIYCSTPGARIYYTTNQGEPIEHDALLYEEPFVLPGSQCDVRYGKGKAFREDGLPSQTTAHRYEFRTAAMVAVTGGSFSVYPHYNVSLTSFQISNYPVSQEEWASVMQGNPNGIAVFPSHFAEQGKHPVESVSWYEAMLYCNRRSAQEGLDLVYSIAGVSDPNTWGNVPWWTGSVWDDVVMDMSKNGYRLPTEMEWYYAAKGGNQSLQYVYSGSFYADEVAWFSENADFSTHIVGEKKANELGLYDMSGNVFEWCWDWHEPDFPNGTVYDPTGPMTGDFRIQKGGSWEHDEDRCEIVFRGRANPHYRYRTNGFRVVRR
ncbi:MAG: SUMF1/EgtB/PvdO family nonheme iron enzyme [Candidatus Cloacimonetes bacterium]|nr:SUMF1/EgtB/PvdO family nonheme iron enzyme [Candidatus Cloacimonadota bacterium]